MATKKPIVDYLVRDVLEAYIEDINGNEYFFGLTTNSNVSRASTKTLIKGGIGAPVVATLSVDDGYEITVDSALYTNELLELRLGGTFDPRNVTIVEASVDESGTTVAEPKEVKGHVIDLDFGMFPTAVKLQLHTVAYDRNTNKIVADIYWNFLKAIPDANFEQAFNMDENNTQQVVFSAMKADGVDKYGEYIVVPRDQESIEVVEEEETP